MRRVMEKLPHRWMLAVWSVRLWVICAGRLTARLSSRDIDVSIAMGDEQKTKHPRIENDLVLLSVVRV